MFQLSYTPAMLQYAKKKKSSLLRFVDDNNNSEKEAHIEM
jgi:hypothetical protein